MADEKVFHTSPGVLIKSTKAIISGKTYEIGAIKSVSVGAVGGRRNEGLILGAIGFVVFMVGILSNVLVVKLLGIALFLFGVVLIAISFAKPSYCVVLETDTGKETLLSGGDKKLLDEVSEAIAAAMYELPNMQMPTGSG